MKERVKKYHDVAKVFASSKRLMILKVLDNNVFGYRQLEKAFKQFSGLSIGSSEMYKHIKILLKYDYIVKAPRGKRYEYMITTKGKKALKIVDDLAKEKVIVPKIRLEF